MSCSLQYVKICGGILLSGFWGGFLFPLFLAGVNWIEEGFGTYRTDVELEWLCDPRLLF